MQAFSAAQGVNCCIRMTLRSAVGIVKQLNYFNYSLPPDIRIKTCPRNKSNVLQSGFSRTNQKMMWKTEDGKKNKKS